MIQITQTKDKELLHEILKQLKANDYMCPCSLTKEPSKDKCMCATFREVINNNVPGTYECNCGRYIAVITKD